CALLFLFPSKTNGTGLLPMPFVFSFVAPNFIFGLILMTLGDIPGFFGYKEAIDSGCSCRPICVGFLSTPSVDIPLVQL
ncbi:hypothetical protein, partial [Paenibacillus sp. MSJ-34]|uniref:hypothetical protein n=1 Tax=Paenibacillus sp. MSJ-34 TaxID=2841529 RepID=UPI001C0F96CB